MKKLFKEILAFSPSYDLAPNPPPPPSPVSELSLFPSLPVCRRSSLLTEEGVGEEPNHTIEYSMSINYYSLTDAKHCCLSPYTVNKHIQVWLSPVKLQIMNVHMLYNQDYALAIF